MNPPTQASADNGSHERWEAAVAAALFVFAVGAFAARLSSNAQGVSAVAALLLFTLLIGITMSLSVARRRGWMRARLSHPLLRLFLAPLALTAGITLYSIVTGLPAVPRAFAFAAYLTAPAMVLGVPRGARAAPIRVLGAALALWLPIEFNLLPSLPLPPPGGFRGGPLVALADGLFLCLIASPVEGIGYTFALRRKDFGIAVLATAAYAVVAVPLGLATGFLHWSPRANVTSILASPMAIYLATGVPEEFLFRGLIQNALARWMGRAALPVAAVIFGFAHLPDLRYVLLAALAGLAYGWVYWRCGRITASAVTHALVDWIWVLLLRAR